MITNKFEIKIASVPDYDDLIAEIWSGQNFICEIVKESEKYAVIMADVSGLKFDYEEFLQILNDAKLRLCE